MEKCNQTTGIDGYNSNTVKQLGLRPNGLQKHLHQGTEYFRLQISDQTTSDYSIQAAAQAIPQQFPGQPGLLAHWFRVSQSTR